MWCRRSCVRCGLGNRGRRGVQALHDRVRLPGDMAQDIAEVVGDVRVILLLLCGVVAKELLCEVVRMYTEVARRDKLVACSECHGEVVSYAHRLVSKCGAQPAHRCTTTRATT